MQVLAYIPGRDGRQYAIYAHNNKRSHKELRLKRLQAAREIGTHLKIEWEILLSIFGKCIRCGIPYEFLNGGGPTKDHIEPLYIGGCDCIANLQPLCRNCNSGRDDHADYRHSADPGWVGKYRLRLSEWFRGR